MTDSKLLIDTLRGIQGKRAPFWFMRQAGRYLPEYREIRKTQKSFLDFCYNPSLASEVTVQPIRRFGMDGAIIFSDILVIPHALGMKVWFEEGHGPRLEPITHQDELNALRIEQVVSFLEPVYEALRQTKKLLPAQVSLLGFVGAPWTLASYMIEGKSGSDFALLKKMATENESLFSSMIDLLTDAIILHAKAQIRAGAEIIQLFDSWAGIADSQQYDRWIIAPAIRFVRELKKEFPDVPLIGFPRQSGEKFSRYAKQTKIDAISFDNSVSLEWVKEHLQPICVVQGNLDPQRLLGEKAELLAAAKKITETLCEKPFVFNLGHGITPPTPIENMQALCEYLKNPV